MFKNGKTRVLDRIIAEVEKMENSVEKYEILMALDAIKHNEDEDMRGIRIEFKAWMKGFGTAVLATGVGVTIGLILDKLK